MTLNIRIKSQFKKYLKKAHRDSHKNTDLLKSLINAYLIQNIPIPEQHKPHLLTGDWKPCRECHIQPDFLLIWGVDQESQELIRVRCGTHTELFG